MTRGLMMSIWRNRNGSHCRHLVGLRVAVARRPALDDVGDVDLVARQADRLDDPGQQLPGAADERLALPVLVLARRLADEHQSASGLPTPNTTCLRPSCTACSARTAGRSRCAAGPALRRGDSGRPARPSPPFTAASPAGRRPCVASSARAPARPRHGRLRRSRQRGSRLTPSRRARRRTRGERRGRRTWSEIGIRIRVGESGVGVGSRESTRLRPRSPRQRWQRGQPGLHRVEDAGGHLRLRLQRHVDRRRRGDDRHGVGVDLEPRVGSRHVVGDDQVGLLPLQLARARAR